MPVFTQDELEQLAAVIAESADSRGAQAAPQISRALTPVWLESWVVSMLVSVADFPYQLLYYWVKQVGEYLDTAVDSVDQLMESLGEYRPVSTQVDQVVDTLVDTLDAAVKRSDIYTSVPTDVSWSASRLAASLGQSRKVVGGSVYDGAKEFRQRVAKFVQAWGDLSAVEDLGRWFETEDVDIDRLFGLKVGADLERYRHALESLQDGRQIMLVARALSDNAPAAVLPDPMTAAREKITSATAVDSAVTEGSLVVTNLPVPLPAGMKLDLQFDSAAIISVPLSNADPAVLYSSYAHNIGGVDYFLIRDGTTPAYIRRGNGRIDLSSGAVNWGIIVDGVQYTTTIPNYNYNSMNIVPDLQAAVDPIGNSVTTVLNITRNVITDTIYFTHVNNTVPHVISGDPAANAAVSQSVGTWDANGPVSSTSIDLGCYPGGTATNVFKYSYDDNGVSGTMSITLPNFWVKVGNVVSAINSSAVGITAYNNGDGRVRIESNSLGNNSELTVEQDCDPLGWSGGLQVRGRDYQPVDLLNDISQQPALNDHAHAKMTSVPYYIGEAMVSGTNLLDIYTDPPDTISAGAKVQVLAGDAQGQIVSVLHYTPPGAPGGVGTIRTAPALKRTTPFVSQLVIRVVRDAVEILACWPEHNLMQVVDNAGGYFVIDGDGQSVASRFSVTADRGLRWVRPGDMLASNGAKLLRIHGDAQQVDVDPPQPTDSSLGEVESAEYYAYQDLKSALISWTPEPVVDWGWLLNQAVLSLDMALRTQLLNYLGQAKTALQQAQTAVSNYLDQIRVSDKIGAMLRWLRSNGRPRMAEYLIHLDFVQALGPGSVARLESELLQATQDGVGDQLGEDIPPDHLVEFNVDNDDGGVDVESEPAEEERPFDPDDPFYF